MVGPDPFISIKSFIFRMFLWNKTGLAPDNLEETTVLISAVFCNLLTLVLITASFQEALTAQENLGSTAPWAAGSSRTGSVCPARCSTACWEGHSSLHDPRWSHRAAETMQGFTENRATLHFRTKGDLRHSVISFGLLCKLALKRSVKILDKSTAEVQKIIKLIKLA